MIFCFQHRTIKEVLKGKIKVGMYEEKQIELFNNLFELESKAFKDLTVLSFYFFILFQI